MRKLDTSNITDTVGMPIKSGTLIHLQDAYTEAISAIMQSQIAGYNANVAYVLYGCALTNISTPFLPLYYNISAGAIFYNGEVFIAPSFNFQEIAILPGQTTTIVATINITSFFTDPTADPVIFTDGNSYNVHQLRTISYGYANSGSGISDFSNFVVIFPSPSWSSLSSALATIPSPVQNYTWTNVGGPYYNIAYRVWGNEVELCGAVTNTIPGQGTFTILTLPAGAIPASEVAFYLNALVGNPITGNVTPFLFQVYTNGQVVINTPTTGAYTIYFDNVKFRLI